MHCFPGVECIRKRLLNVFPNLLKKKNLRVCEECELWSCELRVASCELRVAVASCELRVASCELRVASCSCELQLRVASQGKIIR